MMPDESNYFEKDCSVRVAVRIRPQNSREIIDMCRVCTSVLHNEPQIILGLDKAFTYDFVYDTKSKQEDVYDGCVLRLVEGALRGLNATVLAYGQTGSGKTYTMGSGFDYELCDHQLGIIPRAVQHIFSRIEDNNQELNTDCDNNTEFSVAVQFIELYNEEIIDLLDPYNKKKSFKIQENENGQISIVGASIKPVHTPSDALRCLQQGALARTTASTQMNDQSSRSHAIFTILIRRQRFITSASEFVKDDLETLTAKFHFVDLAGSERLKRTGATGERAREGISINCGLLALGNCISALGDKTKKTLHVPYRDSKLTRLLQDSLGGNSQTIMIACVSPSDRDFMETLNTLKYANRARNIKNKVQVNQDQNSRTISQLRREVASLQLELLEIKQGKRLVDNNGNASISDTFYENEMLLHDNKRLQQRLKSMQETINVLTEKNTQLLLEKEMDKFSSLADTDQSIQNMIAGYLLEIEKLQAKLIESEEMYQQLKKFGESAVVLENKFPINENTESVLEMAKRELRKEREYIMTRSFSYNERAAVEASESEGSDEEDDKAYDVHADLDDVNCDIEIKSKLIEQLELSHKRMVLMKQHYEDKLMLLSSKILSTQRERDEMLANIGSTAENQKDDKINKVRNEYERKIVTMRNEMKKLQQAQREHARQQLEITAQETKLRNLRSQLTELKTIKARLMKTMAEQSNRHKLEENKKKREIAQLQKEHRQQENAVRSLKAKMEAKDQILKRKTEEVSSLRRSQRSIQSSFRLKKKNQEQFDAHSALQSWNNLSRALDKAARNRHMLLQFEQELERLIDERNSLTQTLSNLKSITIGENNDLENEEDSVQSNLNYIQESMKNIQQTIMELDETKDVENYNSNNMQIIITNIKNIEEAKYLLQRLTTYALKLSCSLVIMEGRLTEHVTLLQDSQQENFIQQQLLQHFLAQSSSEKITDLFESITASVSKLSNTNLSDSQRSVKSNETYDIPLTSSTLITADDIACSTSTPILNEITSKIRSRAALQHNMLFGEKK
ncbi:kinesin-like protein KIF21A [Calliphora vicina]|uniref:kinesin-like protein KIF21A n=1 Tax=Calliphora vicina TaxID=7373 RepID=UPI00325ABA43